MNPEQYYNQLLQEKGFYQDEFQQQAVAELQNLYDALVEQQDYRARSWFGKLLSKKHSLSGLYIWGGTGRGKTFLMDVFYECLPFAEKYRVHFHHFMLDVHEQLSHLPKSPDPLEVIATDLAKQIQVLCLDEFHVHDIADAMLMAGLLDAMFRRGIVLVATSNIAIADLYANGLQRDKFVPAIRLLQKHTREINLENIRDYRFLEMEKADTYRLGSREDGDVFLQERMQSLAPCQVDDQKHIEINDRKIKFQSMADDVIWFEFDEICRTPRSAMDYIEIASRFHTVLVGNVPVMQERDDSAVKRFIHLIDALYDHNVKIIMTADARPDELYQGTRFRFAFTRTASRLTEMATEKYMKLPHDPV